MNNHLKSIIKEIKNGKNLEKNIFEYTNYFFQTYAETALLHLTMDYYMLYEIMLDKNEEKNIEIQEMIKNVNNIVRDVFIENKNTVKVNTEKINQIRNEVIKKMKIITTYTDKLQIYEHVLNRIELRFQKNLVLTNQTEFIKKTLSYIFSSKDNVITNNRIKEVVAELPVRMARGKYYQLIKNSFGLFKGAEESALDSFLYHLESAAMLYEPEEMKGHFQNLQKFLQELEQIKFQELEAKEYQELETKFLSYADFCVDVSEQYLGIQSIINHLYAYVLSMEFIQLGNTKEVQACNDIVTAVCELFLQGDSQLIPAEIEGKLIDTEGKQEILALDCEQLETVLYEMQSAREDTIKQLQIEPEINTLHQMEQLMGSSLFVEFTKEEKNEIVSEERLEEVIKSFLNRIAEKFKQNQMCVNRAIVAGTLAQIPNFFHTTDEVKEYLEQSIEQCSDDAERQASINIIQSMIEEDMKL